MVRYVFILIVSVLIAACGGGGSGGGTNSNIISGVASKGPLNGSTVYAYAIYSGAKGAVIGSATNIVNGNYSINLGTYKGSVLLEATGGSYIDESTGTSVVLASPLRSVLTNVTGNTSAAVTALTELAYQQANAAAGGLTAANAKAAITNVQTNFGVPDIVSTMPVDALNVPGSATSAQKTYSLALATVAQFMNAQPTGTTLANALQTINACLSTPATGCGTGSTSLGAQLFAGLVTFQNSHPAFSGLTSPVANAGSVSSTSSTPLTVTPKALTFPTQTPGTSSIVQTVTVTNTGTSAINPINVLYNLPSDFVTKNNCGNNLAIGASCTIDFTFNPTSWVDQYASLTRTDTIGVTAPGANFNIGLSGTLPPLPLPSVSFTPAALTFASQNIGTKSAAQTVTVTNTGNAPLNIYCIDTNGGPVGPLMCGATLGGGNITNFQETNNCKWDYSLIYPPRTHILPGDINGTANLAAGASCTISVIYAPQFGGNNYGLGIYTNAANSPSVNVPLNANTSSTTPTIANISPSTGAVGSSVVISGSNFDATLTNNIVTFNGVKATVTAATSTSLTVTVPSGATTGLVSITIGGSTVTSPTAFTVQAQAVTGQTLTVSMPFTNIVGLQYASFSDQYVPPDSNNGGDTRYIRGWFTSNQASESFIYDIYPTYEILQNDVFTSPTGDDLELNSATHTANSGICLITGTWPYSSDGVVNSCASMGITVNRSSGTIKFVSTPIISAKGPNVGKTGTMSGSLSFNPF